MFKLIKPILITILLIIINTIIFPYEKILLSLFYTATSLPYSKADNEKKFEYIKEFKGSNESFKIIKSNLKRGKIIRDEHIKLVFNGDLMKEDSIVIMRTDLIIPSLKSTTFMRVSTLYDQSDYFEMCLSASEENMIDGYYKYKISINNEDKNASIIKIHITWVLSNPPSLLKFIHKTWDDPKTSIKKTGDYIYNTVTTQ